jgi:class 3 adenylate cyclase/tetratricopeptide (TPR) repeat protein
MRDPRNGDASRGRGASIDELLDRAVAAINRGDRAAATALAGRVLAVDHDNVDATDLLGAPGGGGEIRRLTILFADLVDSTVLSTRVEPETYRLLVGRYRDLVLSVVNRLEGHVGATQGDGLLAVFGHPAAHEDDVRRAVLAGLEITRAVSRLSQQAQRRFGVSINVRVGVHRGLVYLDTAQDDVYGLAANLAARVSGLAQPGTVVVSDAVAPLIGGAFELEGRPPAAVKGVDGLVVHHRVIAERAEPAKIIRGPLVGRDRELRRLEKSLVRAQAGTLSTPGVVFRGEPGIGKSRLAAAAAELVEHSGGVMLELIGSPFHTDAGLHPVRTLLERRCGIRRLTDQAERLRLLEAGIRSCSLDPVCLVPLLAPVLGISAEAGYEPVPAEGRKLYELIAQGVQTYLLACLGGGAGLVVAEDVHWFDPSTLEVLSSLLNAAEGRLLVVITGRPGGWLPAGWPVKVFELTPLTDEQSDALITALNPTVTEDERALVVDRCDGVPFYIEQVVAGLSQTGVPEALYEPLFARLRASANVVPVVEAAAVIGRHVDRGLLCSVIDLSDDEVDDLIDDLEDALVLEPWGPDNWRFRHELLREVAAELAPPSVRRGLHAKVANALIEDVAGGDLDWGVVAGHYERAERFDEAASAYRQASTAARGRGALAEARTHLTQALAQLDHCSPGPDRDRREMAARLERGFLAAAAEGYTSREAAADFERCLRLGGTDLRDDKLVATLSALAGYYIARADLRRTVQVFESLCAGLEGRQWMRPLLESQFGVVAWLRGDFDAARSQLEKATAGWAAADQHEIDAVYFHPNDAIATAYLHLAWTRGLRGDLTGAEAELAQAARRVERLGFPQGPFNQAYTRFVESWVGIEAGQLDRAAVLAADLTELAERHGVDFWRLAGAAQQATVRALAALGADHPDPTTLAAHIATITTLLDTWRTLGLLIYITTYDAVLGRLLIAVGQPEQARARLDTALALARDTGMCFYDAELLRLRAHTQTDPDARRADVGAAVELARRQGATLFELRAALDDYELRGQPARAALIDVAGRIPANNAWPELARAQASLSDDLPRICQTGPVTPLRHADPLEE